MKKIIFLMIFSSLLLSTKSYGQHDSYMSVQYSVSFGMGDQGDFISQPSWRGILVEYRSEVTANLSLGVDVGWNVFYEKKAYDTYTVGTESLSGIQYRYQNPTQSRSKLIQIMMVRCCRSNQHVHNFHSLSLNVYD